MLNLELVIGNLFDIGNYELEINLMPNSQCPNPNKSFNYLMPNWTLDTLDNLFDIGNCELEINWYGF